MDVGGHAPVSSPEDERVGFTISEAAEAVIRGGGGELWIWAGDDGKPCSSVRAPRIYRRAWTTYRPDGLMIRVDSRIVPPWQWRLTTLDGGHEVAARWDGLDPRAFDGQPLEEGSPKRSSSRLAHIGGPHVVVPAVALAAFAVLWVLHFVAAIDLLSVGHLVVTGAIAFVGWIAWLRKKHSEWRADKALQAELKRNPVPLRTVGENQARGGELG
jgi:hypothetical protein